MNRPIFHNKILGKGIAKRGSWSALYNPKMGNIYVRDKKFTWSDLFGRGKSA